MIGNFLLVLGTFVATACAFLMDLCSSTKMKSKKLWMSFLIICILNCSVLILFYFGAVIEYWEETLFKNRPITIDTGFHITLYSSIISLILFFSIYLYNSKFKHVFKNFKTATVMRIYSVYRYPRRALVRKNEERVNKLNLNVKFIYHGWDRYDNKLFQRTFNPELYESVRDLDEIETELLNCFIDQSTSNFDSILYSLPLCEKYWKLFERQHLLELEEAHSAECRYCMKRNLATDQFSIVPECSWNRYEIQVDMESHWSLKNVVFMNLLGFTFLTPFNYPKNLNLSLLDYLQKQENFDEIFDDLYEYITESLLLREDGLTLIQEFINKLQKDNSKKLVIDYVICEIFRGEAPPLWFFCLQACRSFISRGGNIYTLVPKYSFIPELLISFIIDPFSNSDIFNVKAILNLAYQDLWCNNLIRYGLFGSIH